MVVEIEGCSSVGRRLEEVEDRRRTRERRTEQYQGT